VSSAAWEGIVRNKDKNKDKNANEGVLIKINLQVELVPPPSFFIYSLSLYCARKSP
jgi:hypothetical protein